MESAIPAHLAQQRTQAASLPPDWKPPVPSFVARFPQTVRQVVMAYFGVQYRAEGAPALVRRTLAALAAMCDAPGGPVQLDRAGYVDEAGFRTTLAIGYWDDPAQFERWFADARPVWLGEQNSSAEAGFFVEVLQPAVSRFETLLSNDRFEGVAAMSGELSGEIIEHAYWGGARDRLPIAQTDPLEAGDGPVVSGDGARQVVRGQHNLCLIRSGQDWSDTEGEERRIYLEEIEPTLRAGMDFLRDEGQTIGCYANRYLRMLDEDGRLADRSFGMSWWRTLADLDAWAREHPTHLAIFGQAMKYMAVLGPTARLRLHHEVTVAAASEQYFEYLGCHPRTGMLRSAQHVGPQEARASR